MTKHRLKTSPFLAVAVVAALGMGLSACGSSSSDNAADDTPPPVETPDLTPFQSAAASAASAAAAAVMAQEANRAADPGSYAVAKKAADDAAKASQAAASATTVADAQAAQADAEAARDDALMYAGMVMAAQVEANALAAAKTAADTAAGAAEDAADAAEAAAAKVAELTGDTSQQAMDANDAAQAARTAADDARTASDSAQGADNSGDAENYRDMAIAQQGTAETQQANAEELQRESQVAHDASDLQNEARDLADAQGATQDAADSVAAHLTAVQGKAADAHAQALAARAAANRAMSARRDYANANKYAMMAEAEARAAQAALTAAMQANSDAQDALTAANAADNSADAEEQQAIAEAADDAAEKAHTGANGAGMAYMAAKDAAAKAAEASGVNVLGFLALLNGDDTATAALRMARLTAVNTLLSGDAQAGPATTGLAGEAAADASVHRSGDPGSATVTWRYHGNLGEGDAVGGTGDQADTEPGEGQIEIMVATTPALTLTPDDPATAGVDETNFVKGSGLGAFSEYHITTGMGAAAKARAIVFTDKEQAKGPIAAETVTFSNLPPVASRLRDFVAADTGTTYDHDDDPRTTAIPVAVTCLPAGTTCTVTQNSAGTRVTAISGYKISTAPAGFDVPVVVEAEDNTYLAFGAWVVQAENNGDITYGAFANAGAAVAPTAAPITGTATYNGKAAGVHNTPSATNFFHADATLNANFGTAAAQGSVTGRIHNIMSGGNPVSDSIYLDRLEEETNNIDPEGTFNGRARMGAGVAHPQTGVVSYPYEGAWDGSFYNAAPATPPNQAPMSAAGTFGVQHRDMMGTPGDTTDDQTSSFVGAFGAHRN